MLQGHLRQRFDSDMEVQQKGMDGCAHRGLSTTTGLKISTDACSVRKENFFSSLTMLLYIPKVPKLRISKCPPTQNTTSELQPLDRVIIQNFKQHYRKRLLKAVFAKAESRDIEVTTGRFIAVLDTTQWIPSSVKDVNKQTLCNLG